MALRIQARLPLYPPHSRVGAWLTTHEFLSALADRGHDVRVSTYLGGFLWPYEIDGVQVTRSSGIDLAGADVAVSHLGDDQATSRAARLAGVPSVRMLHGVPTPADRLADDLVVANSRSLLALSGWSGPSVVAHPPVWPGDHRVTPGDAVTLINLSPDKGGRLLWRLAARMPDVRFLAVRGGYGRQIVRRAPNVEVIDPVQDMRTVWARTRVLLMPSRFETWGRTAIEAACSGIPTVANPTDGLREALGDGGNWMHRGAIGGWELAVRQLLDSAGWIEASGRALARVNELDPAADVARVVDAIEALGGARRAAA